MLYACVRLTRAAHQGRQLLLSPSRAQVASQRGAECIPLVMEPRSGFYFEPVAVLDFQSPIGRCQVGHIIDEDTKIRVIIYR